MYSVLGASQVVQEVKNLLANAGSIIDEGSVPGLGRSLEEDMATHYSSLVCRILWTEEPGSYIPQEL